MKKPAVFLDRDGTIVVDLQYPREAEKLKFVEGVIPALLEIQKKGFLLFVISNQSGVGRGIISDKDFQAVHQRLCEMLQKEKVQIQEFAYCFHKPEDNCQCRKPETKLIEDLSAEYQIDLGRSFTIGDKWSDVLLGTRVGAKGILLGDSDLKDKPVELEEENFVVCPNWKRVLEYLLAETTPP
jgi:histidinol-phosphate phosphatase family protein